METTLYQHCTNFVQRCFNVGQQRCINVVRRWKSYVGFCLIFNVGSTLFQRWSTKLKQRWSDVEMLAGGLVNRSCDLFALNKLKNNLNSYSDIKLIYQLFTGKNLKLLKMVHFMNKFDFVNFFSPFVKRSSINFLFSDKKYSL